jgi:hypothetical protein
MVDFPILLMTLVVMLSATISMYLSFVIAIVDIKSNDVSYTRHILEFPSEILWVTGKFYNPDIYNNIDINSSYTRTILLVTQTSDGNIHTLDVTASGVPHFLQSATHSNISTFNVNASDDTGGPVITDLNNDNNYEVISTTTNGSLAVIDYGKTMMMLYNNTKLSPRTQIVPYLDSLEGESSLLGVSENATLLTIEPAIMNNENDSSNTSKLAFKVIRTNFSNILTDGRIVVDNINNNDNGSNNEVLLLADPVNSYPHGALGDIFEPTKLLLLELCRDDNSKTSSAFCLKEILMPPEGMEVFETIKPVVIGFANGTKGVAIVASDISVGSAAYIYDETSAIQFSSKPIGQGFRWLLILGAATLNNNQSMLVINETPHLSGIVKFIDIKNTNKTLEIEGFSAHDYGSRNIGMYAIKDVDNDGQDDLIIPTLSKKKITILSISDNNDTIYVNDNLELNNKLSSNITTLDINDDGYVDIIAGDISGNLYIFTSQQMST